VIQISSLDSEFVGLGVLTYYCRWHTAVNLDGSVANMWKFLRENGLRGILEIWPVPSLYAFKLIVCYSMFEALLQLFVPGEEHIGPVSPTGNHPVYKVKSSS
jgi:7-dehydrocholesterol reductase